MKEGEHVRNLFSGTAPSINQKFVDRRKDKISG
jgi:hypothetical protein